MEQGQRRVRRRVSPADSKGQKKQESKRRTVEKQTKKVTDINGYRKRKRRAGSTRWVRLLLFFVLCMVAGYFFSASAFFAVDKISVTGNDSITSEAVKRSSGIKIGDNIFSVSTKKATQWLCVNYMIADARVSKKLPDTIEISVIERKPAAVIPVAGGLLQIDSDGVVIARLKEAEKLGFPIISGLKGVEPNSILGARIKVENISAALDIVAAMSEKAREYITEINVENPQKIVLYTRDNTEVRVGASSDFSEKFELLYSILEAQEDAGLLQTIAYLDVSLPASPAIFYSK